MTATCLAIESLNRPFGTSIQQSVELAIDQLISSLPDPTQLSAEQRRGIIARYAFVLEGNFIYWMTAAYLAAASGEARSIILENLREEVRDCHPGMLRRFVMMARSVPTERDALAVYADLTSVRLFVGQLSGVRTTLMMAFFEGLIQRFMAFLSELAELQGSAELEYTDVHGICDVGHTQGLFQALAAEIALNPSEAEGNLFAGVDLLRTLVQTIVNPTSAKEI